MVHIYSGIILSHEKDEMSPYVTTWMDLDEGIMLSETSQTDKDKYCTISLKIGRAHV